MEECRRRMGVIEFCDGVFTVTVIKFVTLMFISYFYYNLYSSQAQSYKLRISLIMD